jgi:hypothetical protein
MSQIIENKIQKLKDLIQYSIDNQQTNDAIHKIINNQYIPHIYYLLKQIPKIIKSPQAYILSNQYNTKSLILLHKL